LAEVAKRFGLTLEIDMNNSHCPICNTPLKRVDKEELKNELKPNTYRYYETFWRCPNCGQIYWQGAHWKEITATLSEAQNRLN
jgi:uncharacterized protein with PIN domain